MSSRSCMDFRWISKLYAKFASNGYTEFLSRTFSFILFYTNNFNTFFLFSKQRQVFWKGVIVWFSFCASTYRTDILFKKFLDIYYSARYCLKTFYNTKTLIIWFIRYRKRVLLKSMWHYSQNLNFCLLRTFTYPKYLNLVRTKKQFYN